MRKHRTNLLRTKWKLLEKKAWNIEDIRLVVVELRLIWDQMERLCRLSVCHFEVLYASNTFIYPTMDYMSAEVPRKKKPAFPELN